MKRITCCFNCEDRHVGCHAECERYISECAERESERQAVQHGQKEFNDSISCEVARSIRARKWLGRK